MTELIGLICAVVVPWAMGLALVSALMPSNTNSPLRWGAGFYIGFAAAPAMLWVQQLFTGSISFAQPVTVMLAVTAALFVYLLYRPIQSDSSHARFGPGFFTLFMVGVVLLFVLPGIADVLLRPLFPWDAWYTHALQGKIYSHFSELVEFVGQRKWRTQSEPLVFNTYTGHGRLIPLIQTWIALGLGRWSETLVNVPWPLAWFSLGLITTGSALQAGHDRWTAAMTGIAVISVPIIGIHAVLAGYLDLWLAGYCALMAISLSFAMGGNGRMRWFIIAVLSAIAACWAKKFGVLFAVLLSGAALASIPPARTQRYLLPAIGVSGLAAISYLLAGAPIDLAIKIGAVGELGISDGALRIPGMRELALETGSLGAGTVATSLFTSRSLGLWGWICLGLVGLAAGRFFADKQARLATYWAIAIGLASWVAFSFTQASRYLEIGTVTQRFLMVVLTITFPLTLIAILGVHSAPKPRDDHEPHA